MPKQDYLGNNKYFFFFFFEVDLNKIGFNLSQSNALNSKFKWFPLNKGGSFRKWYGNQEYVINYKDNGDELKQFKKSTLRNTQYYFKESLSWSEVSSSSIAFRYYNEGFIFDGTGSSIFANYINKFYLLGFLNSSINQFIVNMISPTLHYTVGSISSLPIILSENYENEIINLVKNNITICKNDWDYYETSWNFKSHPLIDLNGQTIEEKFNSWVKLKNENIHSLNENEYCLNKYFDKIYGYDSSENYQNTLESIIAANYETDIKSFISYVVGCMFGRYSLDEKGLIFAGGNFDLNNYSKFKPDDDNIIPVLDTAYFDDDILIRFEEFVKICFGEDKLEDNLNFIANALYSNNKSSREKIREYLIKNFFNDHKQVYKNCPIYWQFSSGKYNAFNCLINIHRYSPDLVSRIRTDYLHKTQKAIDDQIKQCEFTIKNSSSVSEISNAEKEKNKLLNQQEEIKQYDDALNDIANRHIELDLDDGVKVNYQKFQNVEITKEGQKTKKINLLKKL